MALQREIRYLAATEVRAVGGSGDADPLRIEGYASVFNVVTQLPMFRERIKPGTFTRAIEQRQDVVCLFNHNQDIVLGRTTSGTLRLVQDERGLRYSCDMPNTQNARDIHESIKRGDINGCSFAFMIPDGGQEWSEARDVDGTYYVQRDITDVDLMDVSPVTYPQYSGTDVYARAVAEAPMELRSAVDEKNKALVVVPPAVIEKRADAIDDNLDSFEEAIGQVCDALAKTFPSPEGDPEYNTPVYGGRFYEMETYDDFVIVCECATGAYYKIPYNHDESKPEGQEITFGVPVEVEKEWVIAGRAAANLAVFRAKFPLPTKRQSEDLLGFDGDFEDEDYLRGILGRIGEMNESTKAKYVAAAKKHGIEVPEQKSADFTKEERERIAQAVGRGYGSDDMVSL